MVYLMDDTLVHEYYALFCHAKVIKQLLKYTTLGLTVGSGNDN